MASKKKATKPVKKTLVSRQPNPQSITKVKKKLNLKTIMRPKAAPDSDKAAYLASLRTTPIDVGGSASSTISGFVTNKTDEQKRIEECGNWYRKLVNMEDDKIVPVVAAMIAIRRTYAVALRELNEQLDALRTTHTDIPVELGDFITQMAMYESSKQFNEHTAMKGVIEGIIPWLGDVLDAHTEKEQKDELAERVTENEARKSRPVPIDCKHTPTQEGNSLGRERSLVFVGWRNAVQWLLDQICNTVLAARDEQVYTVVRLMQGTPKPGDQHARFIRVGLNHWKGCANSDRDLAVMAHKNLAQSVNSPIDLLVCDDLGEAHVSAFFGRPQAAKAGDAHKRFRKWCDDISAGFLGALPQDTKTLPDFGQPEFEQLKTFSYLRPVQVLDGNTFDRDDHYRIVVGQDAAVFDVPKDILDSYGSTLIVP